MHPIGKALVLLASGALWASKVLNVTASVSADQVPAGTNFELVVAAEVEGDGTDLPWPELAVPDGLKLVGKNRSNQTRSQVTWINGKFQRSNTTLIRFHHEFQTSKPGSYTIGPVSLQGKNLGTGQIVVGPASNDVRITTLVNRKKVRVGQQVPFTWRLESNLPIEITAFPDIRTILGKGFVSAAPDSQEDSKVVQDAQGKNAVRLDRKGTLFPLVEGKQTLPSTELKWRTVEGGSVDPFEAMRRGEDPFSAMLRPPRIREGTTRTEPVRLEILPVPEAGRPASFQGGVGKFELTAQLQAASPEVGRSMTLVLHLSGNGQPQASGVPTWTAPDGIEAYPPQDTWSSRWRNGELLTALERRIVLVPRKPGTIAMDTVRFSWFDPQSDTFAVREIPLGTIQVAPGKALVGKADTGTSPTSVQPSPSDAVWILVGKISVAIWSALAFGLLAWAASKSISARLSRRGRIRRGLLRTRSSAEGLLRAVPANHSAILRALHEALVLVHGEDAAGWTAQEMSAHLLHSGWSTEEADALAALVLDLEAAAYASLIPEDLESRVSSFFRRLLQDVPT
ncbi:MAG: BatD family protein [Fibrobacteria bacterium]|nr:BatD family protein [Fibrobacteria bacterium]